MADRAKVDCAPGAARVATMRRVRGATVILGVAIAAVSGLSIAFRPAAERVFLYRPATWFEDMSARATISPDGGHALYRSSGGSPRLFNLETGADETATLTGGLTTLETAAFAGPVLARRGVRGSEHGWFLPSADGMLHLVPLPPNATVVWSADARHLAYTQGAEPTDLFVGTIASASSVALKSRITGMAWAPDGLAIYVMAREDRGVSTLLRVPATAPLTPVPVAENLDACPFVSPLSIDAAGHAYVGLASDVAPDLAKRHDPHAGRWLAVYEVDLKNGTRKPLVTSASDNFAPDVAAGSLFWTRNVVDSSVVVVPASGGAPQLVVDHAQFPSWSPTGRQVAFIVGDWRLADWAINLDTGIVDVDARAAATSKPRPFVTGYNEDFTPFWSPDGSWIAYHSHRSTTPVPFYGAPGSADDIWLRRPGGGLADEIRLTTTGWETGQADWNPDGRRLVFVSYERGGQDGVGMAWVIRIDPGSGRTLDLRKLELPSAIGSINNAEWSPSGDAIALESEPAPGRRALWIVAADGTRPRKVIEYAGLTYCGVAWTPDGRTIIYSAVADGRMQLFSIPTAGGAPVLLSHEAANLLHPRVSPDGRWIAATRLSVSKEIWRQSLGK